MTRTDVDDLLGRLTDHGVGVGANRVLATMRKLFSWEVERSDLERNSAEGVETPTGEPDRDRWLSEPN